MCTCQYIRSLKPILMLQSCDWTVLIVGFLGLEDCICVAGSAFYRAAAFCRCRWVSWSYAYVTWVGSVFCRIAAFPSSAFNHHHLQESPVGEDSMADDCSHFHVREWRKLACISRRGAVMPRHSNPRNENYRVSNVDQQRGMIRNIPSSERRAKAQCTTHRGQLRAINKQYSEGDGIAQCGAG